MHLGSHNHPLKIGDYCDSNEKTSSLISKQVERTLTATNSSIILDATKELVGLHLLAREGKEQKTLEFTDFLPSFDRCEQLTSPNVCNFVSSFKYLQRFEIVDSTTKLRGSNN